MIIQKQILNQSNYISPGYKFKKVLLKRSYYKRSSKATSKSWTRILDSDSEKPGPWTRTLKNLDSEKSGPWKTCTLKKLDPKKPGPWKT